MSQWQSSNQIPLSQSLMFKISISLILSHNIDLLHFWLKTYLYLSIDSLQNIQWFASLFLWLWLPDTSRLWFLSHNLSIVFSIFILLRSRLLPRFPIGLFLVLFFCILLWFFDEFFKGFVNFAWHLELVWERWRLTGLILIFEIN